MRVWSPDSRHHLLVWIHVTFTTGGLHGRHFKSSWRNKPNGNQTTAMGQTCKRYNKYLVMKGNDCPGPERCSVNPWYKNMTAHHPVNKVRYRPSDTEMNKCGISTCLWPCCTPYTIRTKLHRHNNIGLILNAASRMFGQHILSINGPTLPLTAIDPIRIFNVVTECLQNLTRHWGPAHMWSTCTDG